MKKIRPHKEDFSETLLYQIDFTANFNKAFKRKFHKTYMGEYITADEFAILGFLNAKPDMSQTKMGKILFRGKAHIGKMLNEMVEKGLVQRTIQEDGGMVLNCMTEKGKEIFQSGACVLEDNIVSKMETEFSEAEIEQFISYLKRYRKVLGSIVDVNLK